MPISLESEAMQADVQSYPSSSVLQEYLAEPVRQMFGIITRYLDFMIERKCYFDRPYIFNERATLSLFAGGIWLADPKENLVLEEFCEDKAETRGRCDIWFATANKTWYGEAKQPDSSWVSTHEFSKNRAMTLLKKTLKKEADTAASVRLEVDYKIGLLFVVPHGKRFDSLQEDLRHYHDTWDASLKKFCEVPDYEILWGHYLHPRLLKENACYKPRKEGWLYRPGVNVLICRRCSPQHERL